MKSNLQIHQHLYNENRPFEGVFSYISKSFGKNSIVISSSGNSNSDSRNILNEAFTGAWISSPNPNSWIKFDLKMIRIYILGYSLRVYKTSRNVAVPHSWCIEGSNDNFKWTLIDEHRRDYSLNSNQPQHFTCQARILKFTTPETIDKDQNDRLPISGNSYRYIRIKQTDTNVQGGNSLCLSNVEIFGYISKI